MLLLLFLPLSLLLFLLLLLLLRRFLFFVLVVLFLSLLLLFVLFLPLLVLFLLLLVLLFDLFRGFGLRCHRWSAAVGSRHVGLMPTERMPTRAFVLLPEVLLVLMTGTYQTSTRLRHLSLSTNPRY